MPFTNSITLGTVTLDGANGGNWIDNLNASKTDGSIKKRLNETISIITIPGRNKEWLIEISGFLAGANRDNDESTLIGYDNGSVRGYYDGIHDGNYIIVPNSLKFAKKNNTKTIYPYSLTLRQYTQTLP